MPYCRKILDLSPLISLLSEPSRNHQKMSLTGRGYFFCLPLIASNLNPSYLQQPFSPTYDILRQVKCDLLPQLHLDSSLHMWQKQTSGNWEDLHNISASLQFANNHIWISVMKPNNILSTKFSKSQGRVKKYSACTIQLVKISKSKNSFKARREC